MSDRRWSVNAELPRHTDWLIQFRWVMFLATALATVFVSVGSIAEHAAHEALLIALVLHLVYGASNVVLSLLSMQHRDFSHRLMFCVLLFDVVVLSVLFHFSGGVANPFTLLFIAQAVIALSLLGFRAGLLIALATAIGYGTLFYGAPHGSVMEHHHHAHHMAVDGQPSLAVIFDNHLLGMFVAFLVTTGVIAFFLERIGRIRKSFGALRELLLKERGEHSRLVSLAALAGQSAHELASPLATIHSIAEELRLRSSSNSADTIHDDLEELLEEVARAKDLLHRMVQRGGMIMAQPFQFVTVSALCELVEETLSQHGDELRVNFHYSDHCSDFSSEKRSVWIPVSGLAQVLMCIIDNSRDAGASILDVTLQVFERGLTITLRDDGPGVNQEILKRLGEPFNSSKSLEEGMGLGLCVAKLFCEQIGGSFSLESKGGCEVRIGIPWSARDLQESGRAA